MGVDRRTHRPSNRQRHLLPLSDHLIVRSGSATKTGSLEIIQSASFEGFERGIASGKLWWDEDCIYDGRLGGGCACPVGEKCRWGGVEVGAELGWRSEGRE